MSIEACKAHTVYFANIQVKKYLKIQRGGLNPVGTPVSGVAYRDGVMQSVARMGWQSRIDRPL